MSERPILNVWGAEYRRHGRAILRGVDLALRPGEIYGLLGAAGSGKSALVGAICGHLRLTGGEVAIDGRDPHRDSGARAILGLAPQRHALFGHLTVGENLRTFGRLAGLRGPALEQAVDRALSAVRARDIRNTPVRRLQAAERRRASVAVAIVHQPRVLILDEPAAVLGMEAREILDAILRDLREAGMTVVLVTHDVDHAGWLADRVGVLREGRKLLEGAPAALVRQAFGEDMEVRVHLAEAPDAVAESLLASEGLSRSDRDAAVWTSLEAEAQEVAEHLGRRLRDVGLPTREIQVAPPSLRSLLDLVADWRGAA